MANLTKIFTLLSQTMNVYSNVPHTDSIVANPMAGPE